MSDFRVSTLYINGARDVRKRANLFGFVRQKSFNVMLVQETHSDFLNETDWRREWDGEVVLSHLSRTSGGVALPFSKIFLPKSHVVEEIVSFLLLFL